MKHTYAASAALVLSLLSSTALAKPLDKNSVLQLTRMGLGDDAVTAKIEADKVDFDLSTDEMVELKKQGITSPVIAAIITNRYVAKVEPSLDSPDPLVPHPAGFYALMGGNGAARMERMEPTVTNQAKTGGIFGYALTGGIASMSVKAALQNATSRVPVSADPKFYFFSAASNGDQSGAWASGTNTIVVSPAELTLIRLVAKDGRREARVGSMNIGGAKTGVMDKDRIAFAHTEIRPGVYEVRPEASLPPGEYGFIYSLSGGVGAMTARIFDFTVR
ncbi:hypothetical protein [Novosphingobium soli]|uniref:Uncharacterized protein n=1 Tax=Novosphingobium soli TaxID=574956 RepID=A0ABV6CYC4_9SPHN